MKRATRILCTVLVLLFVLTAPALAFEDLSKGSKGDAVKGIQTRLIELGFLSGNADGDFGTGTENAVMAYQEANGLTATGIVDEATYNALYEGVENLFSFRGCKWYGTKEEIEQSFFNEGANSNSTPSNEIYRLSATNVSPYSIRITWGKDHSRIEGGGIRVKYSGMSAAGYDIEDTYACYLYPIVNGQINHDDAMAEFYFGWYSFSSDYCTDHEGLYNDLTAKLTNLYGTGKTENDDFSAITWTDVQGNQIRLFMNADKSYVTLGYIAHDAEERLDAMEVALENEAKQEEARSREENASNTSGL